MPNASFTSAARVRCWFCWDDGERATLYGYLGVSGVMVPACQECAGQGNPGFSLAGWVGEAARHGSACVEARGLRQFRPLFCLWQEQRGRP